MEIDDGLEEYTSKILMDNDMYKIPVDVLKIAKNLDIDVYQADMKPGVSGAIRLNDNKKYEILINKNDTKERKRFTIAHELGHFFLDKDILENSNIHVDTLYREPFSDEKRVEYFAGALLINKTLISKMRTEIKTITELAELFEVSVSAMTVRLDILGLL